MGKKRPLKVHRRSQVTGSIYLNMISGGKLLLMWRLSVS